MTIKSSTEQAQSSFVNESENEFTRIDSEDHRTYTFAVDGKKVEIRIDSPILISVSQSGGHRIFDAAMQSHYIPHGWVHLQWTTREGRAHFVK
jgi:hypothetical protein